MKGYSLSRVGWSSETIVTDVTEAEAIVELLKIKDDIESRQSCTILDDNFEMTMPSGDVLIDDQIYLWLAGKLKGDRGSFR